MKQDRVPKLPAGKRSACPIAVVLDLLGDKWTLIIMRDLIFFGKRLYRELAASGEKIPTNILASRLKRLEEAGLIEKTAYQQNPVRYAYSPTTKGADLKDVLIEMIRWGNRHVPGTLKPPASALRKTAPRGRANAKR